MALTGSVGRPRSGPRRRHGATAREEILDAAAQLFTEAGYAATSTRAIAEAVGIKQASLYYHFANKEQILFDLLLTTVQPSRVVAAALLRDGAPAAVRLWTLAAYDVSLLCSGRWNLAALYLLPELRAERFSEFHAERRLLRQDYGELIARCVAEGDVTVEDLTTTTYLAFGLVETVIPLRQEGGTDGDGDLFTDDGRGLSCTVADGVLRLLGYTTRRLRPVRTAGIAWLARHAPEPNPFGEADDVRDGRA